MCANASTKYDLIGKKFGRLTVISTTNKRRWNSIVLLCKCDCGNIIEKPRGQLTSGNTLSCGCLKSDNSKSINNKKREDIINKTVGIFYVKEYTGKTKGRCRLYLCRCKCGNDVIFTHDEMKKRKGCKKCNLFINEFPEMIYEYDYDKNIEVDIYEISTYSHKKVWWKCLECGNSYKAAIYNRTNNGGGCPLCNISKGENIIKKFLDKHNIEYEYCKKFEGCKNIFSLSFDFYLPLYNLCIEFQGRQHYDDFDYWSRGDRFKKQLENDNIKKMFCKNNGIGLVEISYWEIKRTEDILNEWLFLRG